VVSVSSGDVAQQLDYDEFGGVLVDTNPGFQPFGFAGGLYDHQTGLLRFGVRDYDPVIGRFTTREPVVFAGGETNLYAYSAAEPINRIDPLGFKGTLISRINDAIGAERLNDQFGNNRVKTFAEIAAQFQNELDDAAKTSGPCALLINRILDLLGADQAESLDNLLTQLDDEYHDAIIDEDGCPRPPKEALKNLKEILEKRKSEEKACKALVGY
jgi:RHS repeat-associated protein